MQKPLKAPGLSKQCVFFCVNSKVTPLIQITALQMVVNTGENSTERSQEFPKEQIVATDFKSLLSVSEVKSKFTSFFRDKPNQGIQK